MATYTADQLRILAIVERSASVLSVIGVVTIIVTFSWSKHFRNPIHRIILINAFYNMFDVVATTISLSGPDAGNSSALCQFQGFCLQMFPVTDVLWTLAMACDVFLVVFYHYDVEDLHKLEIKYVAVITAIGGIPAVIFLFIHTADKGPMYGSVILWCSISSSWVLYRIVFYYAIIWYVASDPTLLTYSSNTTFSLFARFIILVAMILYCIIGVEILKQRYALKATSNDITQTTISSPTCVSPPSNSFPVAAKVDVQQQSLDNVEFHQEEWTGASSSKGSFARNSTPDLPPSESTVVNHGSPKRSPVSFRQYILMPLMFFVVLLATWVAPSINRVSTFINPSFQSFPLLLAVGSMGSLRGFWNGVVFITVGMKRYKRQTRDREDIPMVR